MVDTQLLTITLLVQDIDECKHKVEELGCSPNSTCVNHAGSFFCKCNHGYMGDGATCYGEFLESPQQNAEITFLLV